MATTKKTTKTSPSARKAATATGARKAADGDRRQGRQCDEAARREEGGRAGEGQP